MTCPTIPILAIALYTIPTLTRISSKNLPCWSISTWHTPRSCFNRSLCRHNPDYHIPSTAAVTVQRTSKDTKCDATWGRTRGLDAKKLLHVSVAGCSPSRSLVTSSSRPQKAMIANTRGIFTEPRYPGRITRYTEGLIRQYNTFSIVSNNMMLNAVAWMLGCYIHTVRPTMLPQPSSPSAPASSSQ
jgi:hypothetical protein